MAELASAAVTAKAVTMSITLVPSRGPSLTSASTSSASTRWYQRKDASSDIGSARLFLASAWVGSTEVPTPGSGGSSCAPSPSA